MGGIGAFIKNIIKKVDPILFGATAFLSLMSLLTIFGAMENFGRSKLVMQAAMTVLGTVLMVIIANLDYKFFIDRFCIIMLVASAVLLLLTLILGISGENMDTANRSWLRLWPGGPMIQPSEFVKITFVCTFAKHIETVKERINKPLTLLGVLAHAGLIVGLILASGDLGVSLVYIGIIAVMLFCSGLSLWYFLGFIGIAVLAAPFLWDFLAPYQQNRIIYGFNPELDPFGYGMQPLMSVDAISQGGFFGKVFREGFFCGGVYEDLAASHTDFIFATVCEKFGFLGGALVLTAIAVIVVRIIFIALSCSDTAGRLVCCGISAIFILQTLENIGMCMALIPVVGITLPFMSAGGSSMLALYIIVGLVHSIRAKEKRFYFKGI
ncbi:MAG: FtsW/RodA/SpoVE family cell cycle protein [Clostridia bacterium]|nr:FtsW/RodA/SpoVE family cell cycle protein [Clostridia bacterium]